MKKTAILLAAIMVLSVSMTACNTDKGKDDSAKPDTTVSDTVKAEEEESEISESESETEETKETEEKSEVNLYENDNLSIELPEGWVQDSSVKEGIAFVAPGETGENVIITNTEKNDKVFSYTKDDFQARLNKTFGTEVNIVKFGVIDVNGAEVLEVVYNIEEDGRHQFSQACRYQNNGDKTFMFVYTNLWEETTENFEKIYNTLKFKNTENSDNTEDEGIKNSANLYEHDYFTFDLGDKWTYNGDKNGIMIFTLKEKPDAKAIDNITVSAASGATDFSLIPEKLYVENIENGLGTKVNVIDFKKEKINGVDAIKFQYSMTFNNAQMVQTQYYVVTPSNATVIYTFTNGGTEPSADATETIKKFTFK